MDEVIIVGAGAAGLAAAKRLAEQNISVTLLEARSRAGGRIHTVFSPEGIPIEQGAEFIHGRNNSLWELIAATDLQTSEVPDRHLRLRDGELIEEPYFWDRLSSALKRISDASEDQSVLNWLEQTDLPPDIRQQVHGFVEGFHGGAVERIGIHGVAKAEAASAREQGQQGFRIQSGYSAVVKWLLAQVLSKNVRALFRTIVRIVRWEHSAVEIEADTVAGPRRLLADRVLITVPLGVLKNPTSRIVFQPELPEKEAVIERMEMGHALRLTLQFRRRFWPENFGFIHSDHEWLPTWWSNDRGLMLTGWAGGTRAECLEKEDSTAILAEAFASLSRIFKIAHEEMADALIDSWHHNWSHDVFSRGAYSFASVGGSELPGVLSQPIADTLFFAGEATNNSGDLGTVHGAMATGYRAADEILSSLSRIHAVEKGARPPRARSDAPRS